MFYTFSVNTSLQVGFITLSLCLILGFATPIQDTDDIEKRVCPEGWLRYERFCVVKGVGSSDREVAIYCDGFGGIGIKGLCIIRAQQAETKSEQHLTGHQTNSDRPEWSDSLLDNWSLKQDKSRKSDLASDQDTSEDSQVSQLNQALYHGGTSLSSDQDLMDETEDTGACPKGWTHYGSLCVYKPWSVQERCRSMNAVEFNGLCLKHADPSALVHYTDGPLLNEVKRVCCCSSVRGRSNGYGC